MFTEGIYPIGDGLLDIDEKRLKGLLVPHDINEIYDVEQTPFARGKFAAVRRAIHKNSGVHFAAKFLKRRRRAQSSDKEIKHEIAVLTLCDGADNIVKLNAVHESRSDTALLLELATGGELQTLLDHEECLSEADARTCMREVLKALQFLHKRSIVHLDLKPQNILLTGERIEDGLKLCDFGISRVVSEGTNVREIVGTPDYVAPEVLQYEPISLLTDIWSVGVLTYVLLSGFSPFGGDTKQETFLNISQCTLEFPDKLFNGVSAAAIDFIRRTLRIKPNDRMTAAGCLEHNWLKDECSMDRQIFNKLTTKTNNHSDNEDDIDDIDDDDDDDDDEINDDNNDDVVKNLTKNGVHDKVELLKATTTSPKTVAVVENFKYSTSANVAALSIDIDGMMHDNFITQQQQQQQFITSRRHSSDANKENTFIAAKKFAPTTIVNNIGFALAKKQHQQQQQQTTSSAIINDIGGIGNSGSGTTTTTTNATVILTPSNNYNETITTSSNVIANIQHLSKEHKNITTIVATSQQQQQQQQHCLFPDAPTTPKVIRKAPTTEISPTSVKALVKKFQLEGNNTTAAIATTTFTPHDANLTKGIIAAAAAATTTTTTTTATNEHKKKYLNLSNNKQSPSPTATTTTTTPPTTIASNLNNNNNYRRSSEPLTAVHKKLTATKMSATTSAPSLTQQCGINYRSTCVFTTNNCRQTTTTIATALTPATITKKSTISNDGNNINITSTNNITNHLNGCISNCNNSSSNSNSSNSNVVGSSSTNASIQHNSHHHQHQRHHHVLPHHQQQQQQQQQQHQYHHHHHHHLNHVVAKSSAANNISLDQGIIC